MRSHFSIPRCALVIALAALPTLGFTANLEITSDVQSELDRQKAFAASWAADPIVVQAVREWNRKGPLAGMDNPTWKTKRSSEAVVKQFRTSPAGELLRDKQRASGGAITEAFLNGAKGEKVAFVEKTTSYIHAGQAKHDVPFGTGKAWQGEPEFDESTQTYAVQIAVPVLDGGAPIGSLVVGVNLSHLKRVAN